MKEIKVRVTLQEDMLGTAPNNQEVYRDYIASKAPDAKSVEDEIASVGVESYSDKMITVFHRNPKTGNPIIYDYLVKGFFKNAANAMRNATGSKSAKLKAYKKHIDNLVFVEPRMIDLQGNYEMKDGKLPLCERPLRASTAQGERIALASSEIIPAGTVLEFTITVLDDTMMGYVYEWLDYGKWNGLGQRHNSGKGRFTWEELPK